MWPRRLIAVFSLLFVLHALLPGITYAAKVCDTETATKALLDSDAFPEEEDDENSDLNLKFLPPVAGAGIPKFSTPYPLYSDTPDYGFITEILTPPPLN